MEEKSFSELIHWLTGKNRKELMEFAGTWKDFDVEEIIKVGGEKFTKNAKIVP